MLLTRIWGDSAYRDPRTIDVHIRHLREKLERDAKDPEYLFTVRGVGYRFRDTETLTPLRSLTNRLALLFFAITLVVIAGVYLGVTSGLEAGVRDQKLDTLSARRAAVLGPDRRRAQPLARPQGARRARAPGRRRARARASRCWASRAGPQGVQTYVASDSTAQREIGDLQFAVALEAARTRRVARGTEAGNVGRVAEAALPLWLTPPGAKRPGVYYVAVYSAPLEDVDATVSLIRQRVLVAGALALLGALLAGYLLARAFSRRVRRMEHAARRVAAGRLRRALRVGRPRRARPARAHAGRDAAPARRARDRARGASSPPPRTSCARRSSRSAASSSCSRTRSSTRRRARPSCTSCASRSTAWASWPPSCSTSRAWRPARSSCAPSRPTSASWPRRVAAEFTPALAAHESHLELRLTGGRVEALCDPERVAQIMRILIDNALNHTPAGTDVVLAADAPQRPRAPVGDRLRHRDPARRPRARLRALLHLRRRPGVGPRPGHRPRAGRAHGRRPQRRERARAHDLRPGAARCEARALARRPRGRARCWPPAAAAAQTTTTRHASQQHDDQASRSSSRPAQRRRRLRPARRSTSASRPAW